MIRSHQSDKAKDVRFAMFEVFGENRLTYINTTVEQNDIQVFKNSHKTKKAFKCQIDEDHNLPYVDAIMKKAWGKKKTSKKTWLLLWQNIQKYLLVIMLFEADMKNIG